MPEVIAETKVNIDSFMQDWRTKFYGQHFPQKLGKIQKNLLEFQQVLMDGDSFLDVGCNVGEVYGFLGHRNYEGIDLSEDAIGKASSKHPEAKFRVCDLFDLEGKWDVVLASRVLMHVAPFEKAMGKLLEVGRKCVVFVPIADEDSCQLLKLFDGQICYFRRFSEHSMRSMGECRIIRHEPYSTVIYGPNLS